MEKLHTFKLAVPVLRVSTKVTHTTPRKPTVLERLILDLCQHQVQLQDYQSMSLATIFTEILKIPEASELTRPAFENLTTLQILQGNYDDLSRLSLADIQLNDHPNVRYFIEQDQLPAQPKADIVKLEYHGVQRTLVSKTLTQSRDHHVIPTLSENLIGDFYPRQLIEDALRPINYPWLSKTSEIVELVELKDSREILYTDIHANLNFDGKNLVLSSQDEKLNQLFYELSPEEHYALIQQVVSQYNGQPVDAEEWAGGQPLSSKDAINFINQQKEIKQLHRGISSRPKLHQGSQLLLHLDVDQLELPLPNIQAALTITCTNAERPELRWEEERAHLTLPNFELPAGVQWLEGSLLDDKLHQWKVADVQLPDKDSQLHTLRILGESELEGNTQLFENLLKDLKSLSIQKIDTESWQRLRIFWVPASDLWNEWLAEPAKPTMRERLKVLQERYSLLGKLNRNVPGQLTNDLLQWLRDQLQADAPLSSSRLKLAVELGQIINPQDKQLKQDYLEWLQINSQPPEDYQNLAEYARLVAPLGKVPSSSCWLHPKLLNDWQSDCGHKQYHKVLDYLPFAGALNNLHQSLIELQTIFSDKWSRLMGDTQSVTALARELYVSPESKTYRQKLRHYQRSYDKQVEQLMAYSLYIDESTSRPLIYRVNQAVACYLNQLSQPDFVLEAASRVFVADSCFLIKEPALPKQLKQGQVLLIPQKVHEELDNLKARKKNKSASAGAGRAIKAIADNERGNVFTIEADLDQLPPEYNKTKADNQILSSALNYQQYEPVLLTDDKNLANKAKGLAIPTLSVAEYRIGDEASTELSRAMIGTDTKTKNTVKEVLL